MHALKNTLAKAGHYERPVGFHRDTHQPVLLKDIIDQTKYLLPLEHLDDAQKESLVIGRWKAGEWSDLYIGQEFIDLERAIKEVSNHTEIGQGLVKNGIRAVEMLLEDIEKAKMKGGQ